MCGHGGKEWGGRWHPAQYTPVRCHVGHFRHAVPGSGNPLAAEGVFALAQVVNMAMDSTVTTHHIEPMKDHFVASKRQTIS